MYERGALVHIVCVCVKEIESRVCAGRQERFLNKLKHMRPLSHTSYTPVIDQEKANSKRYSRNYRIYSKEMRARMKEEGNTHT